MELRTELRNYDIESVVKFFERRSTCPNSHSWWNEFDRSVYRLSFVPGDKEVILEVSARLSQE